MNTPHREAAESDLRTAITRKRTTDIGGSDKQTRSRLGRMVRVARVSRGLTQRELAERVKRSQNLIWSVEAGKTDPGLLFLLSVANALRIPLDFFVVAVSKPRSTSTPGEQAAFEEGRGLLLALMEGLDAETGEPATRKSEKKGKPRH
jgi:transcriptional regulator with XRE-family HTH domain